MKSIFPISSSFFCLVLFPLQVALSGQSASSIVLLTEQSVGLLQSGECNALADQLTVDNSIPLSDTDWNRIIKTCFELKGQKYFADNQFHDGIDSLENALQYEPDDTGLLFALGNGYLQISNYDNAQRAFQTVLELEPENIAAMKFLGQIAYLAGESETAISYWYQAIEHGDQDPLLKKQISRLTREFQATRHSITESDFI